MSLSCNNLNQNRITGARPAADPLAAFPSSGTTSAKSDALGSSVKAMAGVLLTAIGGNASGDMFKGLKMPGQNHKPAEKQDHEKLQKREALELAGIATLRLPRAGLNAVAQSTKSPATDTRKVS